MKHLRALLATTPAIKKLAEEPPIALNKSKHHTYFLPPRSLRGTSPRGMATVHPQVGTGHEAAGVAEKEDGGAPVLLGVAETAQHVGIGPAGLPLGEGVEQGSRHRRDDVAGRDGVDADAVLAPFGREVASQLEHSSLGRIVGTNNPQILVSNLDWWKICK